MKPHPRSKNLRGGGGKTAISLAILSALSSNIACAANDLAHFTEADNNKTIKVETYLNNNLGRWDGRDIVVDGNTNITFESSGMSFGKVTGANATVNFVNDRANGLSTGILIDGNMNSATNYATGPMTVKVKKMTVTNNVDDSSQYGIWAQNKDASGTNLYVEAEEVEINAIKHAISLHAGAVAKFANVKKLTATATEKNALRVVGGAEITIDAVDNAEISLTGGSGGDGINVYDDQSKITINNSNGTNTISSVLNNGTLGVFGKTTVVDKFNNQQTFIGDQLTVKGGFKNSANASINVDELILSHPDWIKGSEYDIQGSIVATDKFVFNVGSFEATEIGASITTKQFIIDGSTTKWTGPIIGNNDVLTNVDEVIIKSNGQRTGLLVKEGIDVTYDKKVTLAGEGDARIQVKKGASMTVGTVVNTATQGKLQLDDVTSSLNAKTINVEAGALNFEVLANNSTGNAEFSVDSINMAANTRLNASVYGDNQPNINIKPINGSLNINLEDNAIVDFGGVKNDNWRSDKIHIDAESINVNVADINQAGKVYLSQEGTNLDQTKITVTADGNNNSGDTATDLQKMANIVAMSSNTGGAESSATTSTAVGTNLSIGEGMYGGAGSATVGKDGTLENVQIQTNSVMSNVLDLGSYMALSINRVLMNDVRKRMGDLRANNGTHGVWARYDGGKLSGSNNYENEFTTIQVGIDTVPDPNTARLGLALAYTKADADMKRGNADMDAFSLAFYGTKIYENGAFVDLVGRFATTDADVTVDGNKKGNLDNVALSLSGEFGWRLDLNDNLYLEPQTELTYTYIDGNNLNLSDGSTYELKSVDSFLGRVGIATGFKCPNNFGDIYLRASAVHEFLGDATVIGGQTSVYKVDGKDTWFEYGLGANFNISDTTYIWADLERTSGSLLDEDWRATFGVRKAF